MDRKTLLVALFLLSTVAGAQDAPAQSLDRSYVSSSEMTYIWKYMGIRLIETYGQVGDGPPYTGKWKKQSFREEVGLRVVIHAATFDNIDARRIADVARMAFDTVSRIAGKPPVSKIELYLTPHDTSYAVKLRSWAIGPHHSVAYAISSRDGGYEDDVSRTVAHELFHTWIDGKQRSQFANELGAATIENCAEMDAFGYASQLDKSKVDSANQARLVGDVAPPAKYTLAARYGADAPLDGLFMDKTIKRGTTNAEALDALCKARAKQAKTQ
jgi:hypothetical protein